MQTYRIAGSVMPRLRDRVAALNRRAERLGCNPIRIETIRIDYTPRNDLTAEDWHVVAIEGAAPRLSGWSFVAELDHRPAGNVIRAVPGETVDRRYRDTFPDCEHCGANIHRVKTYVVRHDDGQEMQVGSTCLRDFVGHASPQAFADYLESVADLADEIEQWTAEEFDPAASRAVDTLRYLEFVAEEILIYGWMSRGEAYERARASTADRAIGNMLADRAIRREPSETAKRRAADALQWARKLPAAADDEYMHNLRIVLSEPYLSYRDAGIAASVFVAQERADRVAAAANSKHFGTVGKRSEFSLSVHQITVREGLYGPTWIVRFIDPVGNVAVWYASREPDFGAGDSVTVRATVKRHNYDRDGAAQTVLTRCALTKGAA